VAGAAVASSMFRRLSPGGSSGGGGGARGAAGERAYEELGGEAGAAGDAGAAAAGDAAAAAAATPAAPARLGGVRGSSNSAGEEDAGVFGEEGGATGGEGEDASVLAEEHARLGGAATLSDAELNSFWKEHDAWKQGVLSRRLSVSVGDPQAGARSLLNPNPPVMFKVSCAQLESSVRRRYSEFEWLRELLARRYVGMVVPALPEKKVVVTDDFLRSRVRGLQGFADRLCGDAYLASDAAVLSFLTLEGREWDLYVRELRPPAPAAPGQAVPPNEGRARYAAALNAYKVPGNEVAAVAKVRAQVLVLEDVLGSLVASVDAVQAAAEAYAQALAAFGRQLAPTAGASAASANALAQACDPVRDVLGSLGDAFAQWATVGQAQPSILEKHLGIALKQELNRVRELLRLFARREELMAEIARRRGQAARAEQERQAAERAARPERAAKIGERMAQGSSQLRRAEIELELTTKGIFFTEIDLFVETRVRDLRDIGAALSKAQLEFLGPLTDVWSNAHARLSLDA
jgi:hypothetical protein